MVQAEQSVIGCLMMAPELLDKARAVLSPAMFEAQPLARIFSCMLELKKAGTPVDAVTVVSRLGDGYEAMIRECACIAPRIGTFPQYAAIVLDAWRERTLVTELQSLAISGRTADEMTAELERMAARQRSIMQKVHSASEQTFGEAVAQAYRDLLKPDTSLKTDWKHFNDVLGGLQRGCLYIIAARPGDGKTDFALHLAVQLAKRCRVDYRSLEMTKDRWLPCNPVTMFDLMGPLFNCNQCVCHYINMSLGVDPARNGQTCEFKIGMKLFICIRVIAQHIGANITGADACLLVEFNGQHLAREFIIWNLGEHGCCIHKHAMTSNRGLVSDTGIIQPGCKIFHLSNPVTEIIFVNALV